MKHPVHPHLMRAMQRKREAGIKLTVWTLATVLVVAAWVGGLVIAYMLGGGEALAAVAVIGTAVIGSVVFVWYMASDDLHPIVEYLYRSRELAELTNEHAWNTQQEELARIQQILKEEQL